MLRLSQIPNVAGTMPSSWLLWPFLDLSFLLEHSPSSVAPSRLALCFCCLRPGVTCFSWTFGSFYWGVAMRNPGTKYAHCHMRHYFQAISVTKRKNTRFLFLIISSYGYCLFHFNTTSMSYGAFTPTVRTRVPNIDIFNHLLYSITKIKSFQNPSPGDLPDPRIVLGLMHCTQLLYHLSHDAHTTPNNKPAK